MRMEADAWKNFLHGLKGWQGSPVPRCHVLSCRRSCPSRSTSSTRSAEQVGQSVKEFHFTYMEESKRIVRLLRESY